MSQAARWASQLEKKKMNGHTQVHVKGMTEKCNSTKLTRKFFAIDSMQIQFKIILRQIMESIMWVSEGVWAPQPQSMIIDWFIRDKVS